MSDLHRSVVALLLPFAVCGALAGCAGLASALGVAAPIAADALAEYQARARELAPQLQANDPRLDELARRLAALEQARTREHAADDCETASAKSSDAAALVQALEDATRARAEATRARDALAAALRAIPVAADAAADGGAL